MTIIEELVERNQGIIEVESVLGQGSAFTVALPNQALRGLPGNIAP